MKKLRVLTVLIFVFGALLFLFGVLLLSALARGVMTGAIRELAAMHQISESAQYSEFFNSSIAYTIIGLASMISAAGLFFLMEGARKLWLGVLIVMALGTIYWFVDEYSKGVLWRTENFIGYPLIVLVISGMWIYFTRKTTKDRFRRA